MGITIKSALEYLKDFDSYSPYQEAIDKVCTYIEQMQAEYENRLREDMIAMLTEIQLDIEESPCKYSDRLGDYSDGVQKGIDIIQQKINNLKEKNNE